MVGCGNYFQVLKDRNCKPRVCAVDNICLTLPSFDWHNVLTAHMGFVFLQMLVNASGACVSQDKSIMFSLR